MDYAFKTRTNKLEIVDVDEPGRCVLFWHPRTSASQSSIRVVREARPDFHVTSVVEHSHQTFLSLTADIARFFAQCARLAPGHEGLPMKSWIAMDVSSCGAGAQEKKSVHTIVAQSPAEDALWTIGLNLEIAAAI